MAVPSQPNYVTAEYVTAEYVTFIDIPRC
jgi:hypothetical protein